MHKILKKSLTTIQRIADSLRCIISVQFNNQSLSYTIVLKLGQLSAQVFYVTWRSETSARACWCNVFVILLIIIAFSRFYNLYHKISKHFAAVWCHNILQILSISFSPNKVENLVDNMLGNHLVTKQTSAKGVKVSKVNSVILIMNIANLRIGILF